MAVKRAVFLDKDGTLIPDIPFNVNTSLITLSDHAIEGLRLLQRLGYLIIVITNQPGIAKGLFSHAQVLATGDKIKSLLKRQGVELSGYYYCPHSPSFFKSWIGLSCTCRKPLPGLLHRAARELNIELNISWMVGDILHDVEAGNLAGCRTILINNGNETEWLVNDSRTPDAIVPHINGAAEYILDMNLQRINYENNTPALYQHF